MFTHRALLMLSASAILTGCFETHKSTTSGNYVRFNYDKVCIDGVAYIKAEGPYAGYLSVKFNKDGNVALCPQETAVK